MNGCVYWIKTRFKFERRGDHTLLPWGEEAALDAAMPFVEFFVGVLSSNGGEQERLTAKEVVEQDS